jgi:hypothetical protein
MRVPQFSKINRHRNFDYTPMYYNPEKEDLDNRVKAIKEEMGEKSESSDVDREARLRAQFKQNSNTLSYKSKNMSSTIRMMIILGLVLYLGYIVFTNLDGFMAKLLN